MSHTSTHNSLHREGYTREYYGFDCWYTRWEDEPWKDVRTGVRIAPGARRNWASASDNHFIAKETAHALLLAKYSASKYADQSKSNES